MDEATSGTPAPPAATEPSGAPDLTAVQEQFFARVEADVRRPLVEAVERYHDALAAIVERALTLAPDDPALGGPDDDAPPDDPELLDAPEDHAPQRDPRTRYEYAGRFIDAFRPDLLDPADRDRAVLFRRLDAIPDLDPGVPETVEAGPAEASAVAPKRIRPGASRRLLGALRRRRTRTVPTGPLARLYLAELAARLEPAVSRAASLDSVALSIVRRQLHVHADPVARSAPGDPAADLAGVVGEIRGHIDEAIRGVEADFSAALAAPAVHIPEEEAGATAARAAQRRERLLEDWQSFETALYENTRSEAVLARALASLALSTTRAVDGIEEVLDQRAHAPLSRLATALETLADEARTLLLDGLEPEAVADLRERASTLFDAELHHLTDRLVPELRTATDRYVEALAAIADTVPQELRISEERIHGIPDRPEKLELRDAPVDELLRAACAGTIPRWIDRSVGATARELDVLGQELVRVRNAVDFHIRAPLRGDFGIQEGVDLIVGSMERAASQLEDLRETGLDPVERLITDLERLAAEEAEAVRSAVAEREFLRIRTEIAEEQATRRISSGLAWGRRLTEAGLRVARAGWDAGRRTYGLTQDWAERQLGVGAVEREEMLESLEASLLGEDQLRVEIPGLYRQLMDVESEVPWEELLVPRPDEVATLQRALERWRRGQPASVAVVGEKGSGKTTLLRMARDLFGDTPVHVLDLDGTVPDPGVLARRIADSVELDTDDWSELAAGMSARGPMAVVLEDAHHMFLRTLGGFRATEAFIGLVAATRQQVFWVITVDEYAWSYLDRALGIAPHFTHTISTTNLSPENLERAIMARHEVSGFALRFELETDSVRGAGWWNRFRRAETHGELTLRERERRAYFRELNQIAEGNVFLALFYWVRSIDRVDDHTLVMSSPRLMDLEFLERLPLPSLHTIAGIILHGGLSEEEHQQVFQLAPAEARLQLAALADAHLVFRSAAGEYKVNKVLYRPLTRLLKTRNIF